MRFLTDALALSIALATQGSCASVVRGSPNAVGGVSLVPRQDECPVSFFVLTFPVLGCTDTRVLGNPLGSVASPTLGQCIGPPPLLPIEPAFMSLFAFTVGASVNYNVEIFESNHCDGTPMRTITVDEIPGGNECENISGSSYRYCPSIGCS
ncbi:hypothetical protein CC78DRAFT_583706 [Lojkania enalia]|uniref:Uncharacterized protein n=1 Tax=Lojkania enalia TaxID=147567 RepID=A0A9P4K4Q1_9PLEO|nr:hypothetical protein CC78DRAFT_583706 [Didymosphaeria enalia]